MRALLTSLVALSACSQWDAPVVRALDYRIDRPRVVAVQTDLEQIGRGQSVLIDGLILSDTPPQSVQVLVCGFVEGQRTRVGDARCFQNDELVQQIATALPAIWTPPEISGDCPDFNDAFTDTFQPDTGVDDTAPPPLVRLCAADVLLAVRATWADGRTAMGSTHIEIASEDGPTPPRELRLPLQLRVPPTASAGDEVALEAVFGDPTRSRGYQWYVSDGELLKTGLTRIQRLEDEYALTDNILRIPDDYSGPLTVALVANGSYFSGQTVWRTAVIEVTP